MPNSDIFYYVADGLGSIKKMIDNADNSVVNSYDYDSFGIPSGWTETVSNPYTYTAREYNSESGDYYYRSRIYKVGIARFLQEDKMSQALENPQTQNKYSYVLNNPLIYTDSYGLWAFSGEAYAGIGGGVVFGQRPEDGRWFITIKFGRGLGGGFSYDPKGTIIGLKNCDEDGILNFSFGPFAEAGIGLMNLEAGVGIQGGAFGHNPGGIDPYITPYSNFGFNAGFRLKGKVAGGVQLTLY